MHRDNGIALCHFEEFPNAHKYSKDHFLSLRVGEVQRIARLSASRTFKFPASAVGTRKYGKVEVYRRVGASPISIDPDLASGANEVEVPIDSGGTVSLIAQVVTTDKKGLQKEKHVEMASSPKGMAESPSHKAVSEYLNKHHLEVRLADAMQKVLRDRPDDPARVLAEMLMGNADKVAKLPVPPELPAPPKLPAYPEAADVPPKASMSPAAPLKASAPLAGEAGSIVPKTSITPFEGYYRSNFLSAESNLNYSKFKGVPQINFPAAAPPVKMLPSMGGFHGPAGHFGGTLLVPRANMGATPKAAPVGGFCPSMGSFNGPTAVYGGTIVTRVKNLSGAAAKAGLKTEGRLLPSMGGCHNPAGVYGGTIRISIETPRLRNTAPPLKLPSVGTWLAFPSSMEVEDLDDDPGDN